MFDLEFGADDSFYILDESFVYLSYKKLYSRD
jgi:hypothetical protein